MTTPHIDKSTVELQHIAAASVPTPSSGQFTFFFNTSNSDHLSVKDSSGTTTDLQAGSGAPSTATYITQTADGGLSAEQALASLATGILKNTTTTGVLSIAAAGTDYLSPTGTENFSNKTITASSLVASALSVLIGGFKAIFTHANTADRTYTFQDSSDTIVGRNTTDTLTNKTLTTPTIASLTNAQHNHTNAAGGGQITDAALSAAVGISKGGTGQTTQTAGFDALSPNTTKGDSTVHNGTNNVRQAIGSNYTHLVADSAASTGQAWRPWSFAIVENQQTSGTNGGSSVATTWTTLTLNTELVDADGIVTLSSNKFKPIAGVYRVHAEQPIIGQENAAATSGRIKLRNVTTTTDLVVSTNVRASANVAISGLIGAIATLDYIITANGTDEFDLQYYVTVALTTNGLGVAISEASAVEHYTRVVLERLA